MDIPTRPSKHLFNTGSTGCILPSCRYGKLGPVANSPTVQRHGQVGNRGNCLPFPAAAVTHNGIITIAEPGLTALIVSVRVPIWFTFTSSALAVFLSIPCCRRFYIGYKKIVANELAFAADGIGEHFPAIPVVSPYSSSMETMGYLTHPSQ